MFSKVNNVKGFTLVEILMVMIILGILVQMSLTFTLDIRKRAYDSTALADGKNLMTTVGGSFVGLEDINFWHNPGGGSAIGTVDTSSNSRSAVFTLSPGVEAWIRGTSPGVPGGGLVTARLHHVNGTNDATSSGKREFWFSIDEMTSFISAPSL